MTTYIEINDVRYPAHIDGKLIDKEWDNRSSKSITLEMNYEDALKLFVNNAEWNIIQETEEIIETIDTNGSIINEVVTKAVSYDNSEYGIAGDITDHRDGTITVKMGKFSEKDLLAMIEGVL